MYQLHAKRFLYKSFLWVALRIFRRRSGLMSEHHVMPLSPLVMKFGPGICINIHLSPRRCGFSRTCRVILLSPSFSVPPLSLRQLMSLFLSYVLKRWKNDMPRTTTLTQSLSLLPCVHLTTSHNIWHEQRPLGSRFRGTHHKYLVVCVPTNSHLVLLHVACIYSHIPDALQLSSRNHTIDRKLFKFR